MEVTGSHLQYAVSIELPQTMTPKPGKATTSPEPSPTTPPSVITVCGLRLGTPPGRPKGVIERAVAPGG